MGFGRKQKQKKYRNSYSLRSRLSVYFVEFAFMLLAILWALQTLFLEDFYENAMVKKVQSSVSTLSMAYSTTKDLDFTAFVESVARISTDNDIYFYIDADDDSFAMSSIDQASYGRMYYYGKGGIELAKAKLFANNNEPITYKTSDPDGESVTLVYAAKVESIYRSGVYFYAFAPLAPMGAAVGILAEQLFDVTVISFFLAVFIGFIIAKRISDPMSKIEASARELAKGNYDVKFEGSPYSEINSLTITLNHTAKELGKTDSLQKDLLANVSHDLRTPLTMVKSYAEMIRDISGDNKEKREEHLNVIIEEADRLSHLVNDILAISRLQAGVETMDKKPVDLQKLAAGILATYRVLEEQDEFKFNLQTLPGKYLVEADEHRIEQVISNFISNAVRYSGDIKVIDVIFTTEGKRLRLAVKDRGVGIDPSELNTVWDRYEQASKRGRRASVGTGLGLNIAKEILESHDARYGVESAVGRGSTFWFSLPLID